MRARHELVVQLRWLWVMLGVAAVLVIVLVVSGAMSGPPEEVMVVGPTVKTGNPADYLEPPPSPPVKPTPTTLPPSPPAETSDQAQPGTPRAFTYAGQMWVLSDGPVRVNVESIGKLPDGHVVYAEVEDTPPYDALYLETAPNSGLYQKYVPASSTPDGSDQ